MDLNVRDVARLLNLSEQTIYRWARQGSLPAHRVHDQYLFNRVELQEWAAQHKRRISPALFTPEGEADEQPSLSAAVERGGVYYRVPGGRPNQVLKAVSELAGIPPGVDRALLCQLLVARESMASTGVGDGIAFPHPRDPLVVPVDEPRVLLCLLAEPVDFRAIDGKPVRALFVLLSPSVRLHLQILARLAFALHDTKLKELLLAAAPQEALLERLLKVETGA